MKTLLIYIFRGFLSVVYFFIKLFTPVKNRITFLSRQNDVPGIDFKMLSEELYKNYPQYEQKMMCRKIPGNIKGMISYGFHIFSQMRAIASSKVVVLDTYCIPVSLLKHKKSLTVIQIWHAMGAFKRFALSVAGQPEGSPLNIVKAMRMHKGYDYALCTGDSCVPHFSEAFGLEEEKFLPIGLPRMDYLAEPSYIEAIKEKVLSAYPELGNGKKNILYVPTFRRANGKNDYDMDEPVKRVCAAADLAKYNLVIKTHSGSEVVITEDSRREDSLFMGMDMVVVSDYIISDYSSIIFEAAVAEKPCYLYCYDREDYVNNRGLYIDYDKDIPAFKSGDIKELMNAIDNGIAPAKEENDNFVRRFAYRRYGAVTPLLASVIDEMARGVYDGRYNYKA